MAEAQQVDAALIESLSKALSNESLPLSQRYRALFGLKHQACLNPPTEFTVPSIHGIAAAFSSPSALLKHEVAYCLGQTDNLIAAPYLRKLFLTMDEDPMCRHEAAEALGALGDADSLDMMRRSRDDATEPTVVRETCDIAIDRIEWAQSESAKVEKLKKSDFASIDPAPPLAQTSTQSSIPELQEALLDTKRPLFQRYRAMFALRDLACPPNAPTAVDAVKALATGFTDGSALFRHEIAFVFGQLSHPASIPSLVEALKNLKEDAMVRHEAAEALGGLGEEEGVEVILRQFLDDPEQVVRESVVVALDMAEFEKSGELQYATLPASTEHSPLVASKV